MESFKLLTISQNNILSSCSQDKTTIFYDGSSLIYSEASQKVLPWFKDPGMIPVELTLSSGILAILTKDGTLLILPTSSISESSLSAEWKKFISKNFFSLINQSRQDNIIDMLSGCVINRDRPFENYLDVSIFKLKSPDFVGIAWFKQYLIISLTNALWVINPVSSALENKLSVKSKLLKTEVAQGTLVLFTDDGVYLVPFSEILNEKFEIVKTLWKGTINVFAEIGKVGICNGQKMELHCLEQGAGGVETYWVPEGYGRYFLWKKFVVCIDPGVCVVACVPAARPRMLPVVEESGKMCICGGCVHKETTINYSEWIYLTSETCVIWKTWESIGNVYLYSLYEDYVEIITESGIYQLSQVKFDITPKLIDAIDREDITRVHQLIHIAANKEKDLDSYLNEIAKSSPKLRALRLFIFSNNPPLVITDLYFSEVALHTELYNYLWASYFSIPVAALSQFAMTVCKLLSSILGFCPSNQQGPILSFQPSSHKSLFGRLDIEPGLCHLLPLLVRCDRNLPINKLMLYIVKENFNSLRPSIQLTLIIFAEQLSIDLPVHKLITISEQLQSCKILRILLRLSSPQILFKKNSPIFPPDKFLSLLPLPINRSYSVRTTKITKKSGFTEKVSLKKISEQIQKFVESFEKAKENFNSLFNSTLTKYIILFGYAAHKEQSEEILNIFVQLLRKFEGFYELHQIFLNATALRSYIVLAGIYEFQENWVSVFKARLLMNVVDPLTLLKSFLEKGEEEDRKALMIYSCFLYCQKTGVNKSGFLERVLPDKHENLIKFVLTHAPEA